MIKRSYIHKQGDNDAYIPKEIVSQVKKSLRTLRKESELLTILKALSDPTKLTVYLLLKQIDALPVSDIAEILDASQSCVSHALADLKKIELVECHRCGQLRCYSLKKQSSEKQALLETLSQLFI